MVDGGEFVVLVWWREALRFWDLQVAARGSSADLVPQATAKTASQGLKGSKGCGEWNSSGSFSAFRMTARTRLPWEAGDTVPLGAEGASEVREGFDDLCGPLRELVVAQGAVVGLEDGAEEERVDTGVFCVAPDFDGLEILEFGDG